jgi:excisionase family DNA binding protein
MEVHRRESAVSLGSQNGQASQKWSSLTPKQAYVHSTRVGLDRRVSSQFDRPQEAVRMYLTTSQVATKLGVTPATVRRWIADRGLIAHNIGSPGSPRMRVTDTDLTTWVEQPEADKNATVLGPEVATPAA